MASLNKVEFIGYTGDVPEVRYMTSGDAVAVFSLATNEEWKDKAGEKQSRTDWHRIVMYRGLAEIAEKHFKKGEHLYIAGKLRNRSWEDTEGKKHYVTEIIADEFKFLDKKDANDEKLKTAKPSYAPAPSPAEWEEDRPF